VFRTVAVGPANTAIFGRGSSAGAGGWTDPADSAAGKEPAPSAAKAKVSSDLEKNGRNRRRAKHGGMPVRFVSPESTGNSGKDAIIQPAYAQIAVGMRTFSA
jgi:hypothetical protein